MSLLRDTSRQGRRKRTSPRQAVVASTLPRSGSGGTAGSPHAPARPQPLLPRFPRASRADDRAASTTCREAPGTRQVRGVWSAPSRPGRWRLTLMAARAPRRDGERVTACGPGRRPRACRAGLSSAGADGPRHEAVPLLPSRRWGRDGSHAGAGARAAWPGAELPRDGARRAVMSKIARTRARARAAPRGRRATHGRSAARPSVRLPRPGPRPAGPRVCLRSREAAARQDANQHRTQRPAPTAPAGADPPYLDQVFRRSKKVVCCE